MLDAESGKEARTINTKSVSASALAPFIDGEQIMQSHSSHTSPPNSHNLARGSTDAEHHMEPIFANQQRT